MISATDVDPSPGVPHANAAAYRRISAQVKTRPWATGRNLNRPTSPGGHLSGWALFFRFVSTGDITVLL